MAKEPCGIHVEIKTIRLRNYHCLFRDNSVNFHQHDVFAILKLIQLLHDANLTIN